VTPLLGVDRPELPGHAAVGVAHNDAERAASGSSASTLRYSAAGRRALAYLHREPAHPRTLGELAQRAGVSRSVLAE